MTQSGEEPLKIGCSTRTAYRTVVAVQLGNKLYVLHAFQKKSKRGIATPKADMDLVKRRYKEATELAKHDT
jgi:phage-related protein